MEKKKAFIFQLIHWVLHRSKYGSAKINCIFADSIYFSEINNEKTVSYNKNTPLLIRLEADIDSVTKTKLLVLRECTSTKSGTRYLNAIDNSRTVLAAGIVHFDYLQDKISPKSCRWLTDTTRSWH